MAVTIYALSSPLDPEAVRYVGLTSLRVSKRYNLHLSSARHGAQQPVSLWIAKLIRNGCLPVIRILEEGVVSDREAHWISFYRDGGYRLLNLSSGGEKSPIGVKRSVVTRKRMSDAQRGNQHRLGKKNSTSQNAAISAAMMGNRNGAFLRTEVHRESTRQAMLGHSVSAETRIKIADSLTGRVLPIEVRERISKTLKQRPVEKSGRKLRGEEHWSRHKSFSAEARRKMSNSAKRRHEREREAMLSGEAVAPLPEGYAS